MYKEADGKQPVHDYEPIVRRFVHERELQLQEIDRLALDIYDPYAVLEWLLHSGKLIERSTYLSKLACGLTNSPKGLSDLVIAETNEGIADIIYSITRFKQTNGTKVVISEPEGKKLTKELDLLIHDQNPTDENWKYAYETRPWTADELEFDRDSLQIDRVVELTRSNRADYIDDKVKRFKNAALRFPNVFAKDSKLLFGVPSDSLLPVEDCQKYPLPYDVTTINTLGARVYRFLGGNIQPDSPRERREKTRRFTKQDRRRIYSYAH